MKVILSPFLFCLVVSYCYGDGNVAEIHQSGGGENVAVIEQNGCNNTAIVEQSSPVGFFKDFSNKDLIIRQFQWQLGRSSEQGLFVQGNNNFISQFQQGDRNFASLSVKGNGNWVKQVQIGNKNKSIAEIFGKFNSVFHLQYGNGLILPTISVMGNGQEFYMIQRGDKEK